MGKAIYFPLVSGLLRAYAETRLAIKQNYQFMPFLFNYDEPERIISKYDNPSVAAFSVSMWNEQLNLKIAKEIKNYYTDCLIIFGGPQIPHYPELYFSKYHFIDIAVRGEGEMAFAKVLERLLTTRNFYGIPGIAWRDPKTSTCIRNDEDSAQPKNLDVFPSPYLAGLFDDLFEKYDDFKFQAIIETNRGCPFTCAYCFWGQSDVIRKFRFFSLARVKAELEWCARKNIEYVFSADANFGIHKRDIEIAHALVKTKEKYGYPKKFRSCFTKNADDRIFELSMLLFENGMDKGVTLSFQSNDEQVLKNVNRKNIKLSTYWNLQKRFNEKKVPVYTELILGLPGENYKTWTYGINNIIESGLKGQLFVYPCEVYPNTLMADKLYQEKFGIVTRKIVLTEIHGTIRKTTLPEYLNIIITTNTMPLREWRKMMIFSWVTMLFYSLKLGFFIYYYLADKFKIKFIDFIKFICDAGETRTDCKIIIKELKLMHEHLDKILQGHGKGYVLEEFGDIYWDMEEASFLRISSKLDQFYDQLLILLKAFLKKMGIIFSNEELIEVTKYQRLRIPSFIHPQANVYKFNFNIPEYFESVLYSPKPVQIKYKPQTLKIFQEKFNGKMDFARKTILWNRKSNKILNSVQHKTNKKERLINVCN